MQGIPNLSVYCLLVLATCMLPENEAAAQYWQPPFDTTASTAEATDSIISFTDALGLAAAKNPTLRSLNFERRAAEAQLDQAGLWSNPEIEIELEDVGGDAPGFRESEITISVAQEFELFGQRGARKGLARAQIEAAEFQARAEAFDLFLEIKRRFYRLAHARQRLELSAASLDVAAEVVRNIEFRIEKGAALQSELLLAQLQYQRTTLRLDQAKQEVVAAETALVALWGGRQNGLVVAADMEPDTDMAARVALLEHRIDSTRAIMRLQRRSAVARAERSLAAAEAKPGITLRGGVKRFEADNSSSFLIGVSIPLPFFNRNQGDRNRLEASLRSLDYRIDRARLEAEAEIHAHSTQLLHLIHRHDVLDSLLVPTAENVYETLRRAYESGRLPYTQLLEAERSLNELRFEHNDMVMAIQEQIIVLEGLTGLAFLTDREK